MRPATNSALPNAAEVESSPTDATEVRATFARMFREAEKREPVEVSILQSLVGAFVRAAKDRGEPPQRVIGSLKDLTINNTRWYNASTHQRQLRESLIRWCLDEYYGPDATQGPHRENERQVQSEAGRSD